MSFATNPDMLKLSKAAVKINILDSEAENVLGSDEGPGAADEEHHSDVDDRG